MKSKNQMYNVKSFHTNCTQLHRIQKMSINRICIKIFLNCVSTYSNKVKVEDYFKLVFIVVTTPTFSVMQLLSLCTFLYIGYTSEGILGKSKIPYLIRRPFSTMHLQWDLGCSVFPRAYSFPKNFYPNVHYFVSCSRGTKDLTNT